MDHYAASRFFAVNARPFPAETGSKNGICGSRLSSLWDGHVHRGGYNIQLVEKLFDDIASLLLEPRSMEFREDFFPDSVPFSLFGASRNENKCAHIRLSRRD
jgi:hypothetical protein